jgi:hypothetical protein
LSFEAVDDWVEKFSQGSSRAADDARQSEEVAEIIVKRSLWCGFRRTDKTIDKCVSVGGGYVEKHKVIISHVLSFIFICDIFTDSLS